MQTYSHVRCLYEKHKAINIGDLSPEKFLSHCIKVPANTGTAVTSYLQMIDKITTSMDSEGVKRLFQVLP